MEYDVLVWYANPIAFGSIVAAIVAWLRQLMPKIDGLWEVSGVAALVGILLGIPGDYLNLITVKPYADMPFLVSGALYGLTGAATAFTSVSLIKYLIETGVKLAASNANRR